MEPPGWPSPSRPPGASEDTQPARISGPYGSAAEPCQRQRASGRSEPPTRASTGPWVHWWTPPLREPVGPQVCQWTPPRKPWHVHGCAGRPHHVSHSRPPGTPVDPPLRDSMGPQAHQWTPCTSSGGARGAMVDAPANPSREPGVMVDPPCEPRQALGVPVEPPRAPAGPHCGIGPTLANHRRPPGVAVDPPL